MAPKQRRGALLLLLAGIACSCAPPPTPIESPRPDPASAVALHEHSDVGSAVVAEIIDGDTIVIDRLDHTETVRLIGIDTPETVKPDSPVECFGPEATALVAELIPVGTDINLVRDLESRDRYGRLLAYVVRSSDLLFVNLALVRQGVADTASYPPNTTHVVDFAKAKADARAAGLGLWSACAAN